MERRTRVPPEAASLTDHDSEIYKNLWRAARRQKWRVLLGLIVGVALAAGYAALKGAPYESQAQLLVIKKKLDTTPITGPADLGQQNPDDFLATHQVVITSDRLVRRAVQKVNLQRLECFRGKDENEVVRSITRALTATRDMPLAGVVSSNNILNLAYQTSRPEDTAPVLIAIIGSYQDFLRDTYRNGNKEALELVDRARDVLEKDLLSREAAYREFRKKNQLIRKGDGSTVHQDRLFTIDARRSTLRMRQAEIEATLAAIHKAQQAGRKPAEILNLAAVRPTRPDVVATGLLSTPEPWEGARNSRVSLDEELVNLQLQEGKLLEDLGPKHPDVKAIRKRIEAVRGMITPSADQDRAGEQEQRDRQAVAMNVQLLKREYQENERADQALAALYQREQKDAAADTLYEVEDQDFRRNIDRSRELYESIVKRLREIDSVRDFGGFETEVLAPPVAGKPVYRKLMIPGGFLLLTGLLLGAGWGYLAESSDKRFRTARDINMRLGLPILGHIPTLSPGKSTSSNGAALDPILCTYNRPHSVESEAFRSLRTALCFRAHLADTKVILITSPEPASGKTTCAANLAVVLAQAGKKVLLLDADVRQPRLHDVFGLEGDSGLESILSGKLSLVEAVQQTSIPGLSVLSCARLPESPLEVATSAKFTEIVKTVRQQFDFVLIDGPPALTVADACAMANLVDAVLLTLRLSRTSWTRAQHAVEALENSGARLLGVVVNESGRPDRFASLVYEQYTESVV